MKQLSIILFGLILGFIIGMNITLLKIEKQLKELKEIKMTVDNMESQIKLLTPPLEFFSLPVVPRP